MMEIGDREIDDFILGNLDGELLAFFEKKLQEDSSLKKKVASRRQILEGVEWFGNQQLKEKLKRIHQEKITKTQKTPTKVKTLRPFRWLGAVAAVALLFLIGYHCLSDKGFSKNGEQLFAEHYTPYNVDFGTRDNTTINILGEAEALYQQKKYVQAIPLLEQIEKEEPSSKLKIVLGNAYLNTRAFNQAESIFKQVVASNDPFFKDKANWYLSLLYLKKGDTELARQTLQLLAKDDEADHHKEAVKLLEEL